MPATGCLPVIESSFRIEFATWSADQADLRAVRTEVFIVEQNIPEAEEWDELDARSIHVLARDEGGRAIATGRLTPDRKIGRMAVVAAWRGKGVGEAIMRTLIEQARAMHYDSILLHAQTHAVAFYERAGFKVEGDVFDECGIPHQHMRLALPPTTPPPRAGDRIIATPAPDPVAIGSLFDAQREVDALLEAARHRIYLYSRDLDALLFDREPALSLVKQIALGGRNAEVRILLHDPIVPVRDGHRLLHLAQRLSTAIMVRAPVTDDDRQYASAFLLNDVGGYYFRPVGSRYDGEANPHGVARHAELLRYFQQVWERAEPHPELRNAPL
jgi:predicted GNAT family N-acyltransferase